MIYYFLIFSISFDTVSRSLIAEKSAENPTAVVVDNILLVEDIVGCNDDTLVNSLLVVDNAVDCSNNPPVLGCNVVVVVGCIKPLLVGCNTVLLVEGCNIVLLVVGCNIVVGSIKPLLVGCNTVLLVVGCSILLVVDCSTLLVGCSILVVTVDELCCNVVDVVTCDVTLDVDRLDPNCNSFINYLNYI